MIATATPTTNDAGYVSERFPGGYIVFKDHGAHLELVTLSIEQRYQGRGIGSKVLREIKQNAGKPIHLIPVAMEANRDADLARFYARHGFAEQYPGSDWLVWTP